MSRPFRLHTVTWNVNKSSPPGNLTSLLGLEAKVRPNLIAIGLQELMPDTTNSVVDSISDNEWTKRIVSTLSPFGYVRVSGVQMRRLQLSLYIENSYMMGIKEVEYKFYKHKFDEGIATRMTCLWGTMCFVNSYVEYHDSGGPALFCEDMLKNFKFRDHDILKQDFLFWLGYFEFPLTAKGQQNILKGRLLMKQYNRFFQLDNEASESNVSKKFKEGVISFPPTFNSTLWEPEWTDHILAMVNMQDMFQPMYTSHEQYHKNDHTPVTSSFLLGVDQVDPMEPLSYPDMVQFSVAPRWNRYKDKPFTFTVSKYHITSNRDWIGIVPANFIGFDEYIKRVFLPKEGEEIETSVHYRSYFTVEDLNKVPIGTHKLIYFNDFNNYVLGHSDEFEVFDFDRDGPIII